MNKIYYTSLHRCFSLYQFYIECRPLLIMWCDLMCQWLHPLPQYEIQIRIRNLVYSSHRLLQIPRYIIANIMVDLWLKRLQFPAMINVNLNLCIIVSQRTSDRQIFYWVQFPISCCVALWSVIFIFNYIVRPEHRPELTTKTTKHLLKSWLNSKTYVLRSSRIATCKYLTTMLSFPECHWILDLVNMSMSNVGVRFRTY